jgi:inner membrane protein
MRKSKASVARIKWNYWGLGISTSYLLIGLTLNFFSYQAFQKALVEQNISYLEIQNRPAPFTTLLWSANVKTKEGFYLGDYSFFDTQPISFRFFPVDGAIAKDIQGEYDLKRLQKISGGWYIYSKNEDGDLLFNDLRFGLLSFAPEEYRFVFSYKLYYKNETFKVADFRKTPDDGKQLVLQLWQRIKGN